MGQGKGGIAPEKKTDVDFKTERQKIHTGKGAIIGQFLIDGEQVRGDVSSGFGELVTASERQASDLIHRDRVPRQYHKAVKGYFSHLQESNAKKPPAKQEVPQGPASPSIEPDRPPGGDQ